jgi:AraC-type DNA-binding domain-containing proteins
MKILKQFDPLVIEDVQETSFSCSHHSHTYYELVYIQSGKGKHLFNDTRVTYSDGDLFLLAPSDEHSFEIDEPTHFTYIKFTESYFESKKHLAPDEFRIGSPEFLMQMKWLKEVKICIEDPCKTILKNTINNIVKYDLSKSVSSSPIIYYQLLSVFGIIREVLKDRNISQNKLELNFEKLLSYIHENIYDRDKLLVKNVAEHFHISVSYFSNYFKRHFDIAYQEYLDNYRVTLIEKRLNVGGLKLKQIADEFGFTDVSHLSKTFRKVKGFAPKDYVKNTTK